MGIFITQGLVIGWLGVALGIGARAAAGAATSTPSCRSSSTPSASRSWTADVYYITSIPSEVHLAQRRSPSASRALLLTALATVYPAMRAARTAPAEALRYE